MFDQQEIQILLGGVNAPIDLDELRAHTNYGGLYDDKEQTIVAFWKVIASHGEESRTFELSVVFRLSTLWIKNTAGHFYDS